MATQTTPPDTITSPSSLILPDDITSPMDVARMLREIKTIDEFIAQANIRGTGSTTKPPRTNPLLETMAEDNKVNLLNADQRAYLTEALEHIHTNAPVVHISFAADPPRRFMARIAKWFRANAHPYTLLQIGLQPGIAGGCMLRVGSRFYDLSLRQYFDEHYQILVDKIKEEDARADQEVTAS